MNLSNKSELMHILSEFNFSFSKNLGQNFLIDKNILEKIVKNSKINENSNILEIGPGAGTLTHELCKVAKNVVAVEIDKRIIPVLNYVMSGFDNFTLINQDIMKADLKELIASSFDNESFTVVANLPYYITTPIIMNLFENDFNVNSMTLMIQKEVASRMIANAGSKDYGALTVAVKYYSKPEIICTVPPHCFVPQPKVTSTVIKLDVYENSPYCVNNKEKFFKIVKSIFSQRRKTLVNSLSQSPFINYDKGRIIDVLNKMGLNEKIRGEKLEIDIIAELANNLE